MVNSKVADNPVKRIDAEPMLLTSKFWWNVVKILFGLAPLTLFLPFVRYDSVAGYKGYTISAFHMLIGTHGLDGLLKSNNLKPMSFLLATVLFFVLGLVLVFLIYRRRPTIFTLAVSIPTIVSSYFFASMFTWIVKQGAHLMIGFRLLFFIQLAIMVSTIIAIVLNRVSARTGAFKSHLAMFSMLAPGLLYLIVFSYLPMPGIVLAFKRYKVFGRNVLENFYKSEWVMFENFKYLFSSPDAAMITRNTILYNVTFLLLGLVASVGLAILISELPNRRLAKIYQTTYFLPYFLSWMVVAYLGFALFNYELGVLNRLLKNLGMDPVDWYMEPKYWPFIYVIANIWKYTGNGSIVYIAAIAGFDPEIYEAASIDGAGRWKQTTYLTIPMLVPMMTLLTILAVGRIFNADLGMFLSLPMGSGPLRSVSNVIDLYVFNSLRGGSNMGFPAAAALYQSVVGFVLILTTNTIVRRINPDNALF